MSAKTPQKTARWRYVLPNAVTCCGLLIGLASISSALKGEYLDAGWLIILCAVLDKLDGTLARLLKATSQIGMQLDSFSDFVSFGIAPGALAFTLIQGNPPDSGVGAYADWHTAGMSYLNHALCATFVLCAAIRLAKFNVITDAAVDRTGNTVFYGIPSTITGAFVAATVIVGIKYEFTSVLYYLPYGMLGFSLLMILNFPIPKISNRKSILANGTLLVNAILGSVCGIFRLWPEYLFFMIGGFMVFAIVWSIIYHKTLEAKRLDPYPEQ